MSPLLYRLGYATTNKQTIARYKKCVNRSFQISVELKKNFISAKKNYNIYRRKSIWVAFFLLNKLHRMMHFSFDKSFENSYIYFK